jgi:organic hydroperoxide reductase OsmC/OhrA
MAVKSKQLEFPVAVEWAGGKRVRAYVEGKQMIEVATPPEFNGDFPDTWSPEDFLVAALASCYSVTMVGICGRRGIPLYDLSVDAVGRIGPREDGRFGFQAIELEVTIEAGPDQLDAVREAAERAERGCLVSLALEIPVEVELNLCAAQPIGSRAAG